MPVCIQKIKNQRVSCSHMILQCKSCQRNLTASKISKINYNYQLRTLKKNVTYIDFLAHPGPNVPYVFDIPTACAKCSFISQDNV